MYLQILQTVLVSFALKPCSKKWWISHVVVELVQGGPSTAGLSVPGTTQWDGLAGLVGVADPAAGLTLTREADSVEAGCSSCSSPLEGPFGSPSETPPLNWKEDRLVVWLPILFVDKVVAAALLKNQQRYEVAEVQVVVMIFLL